MTLGEWMKHISESRVKTHTYIAQLIQKSDTIEFLVSEKRDKNAARRFFKKALNTTHDQQPRAMTTDEYSATIAIVEEMYYGDLNCRTQHRMNQY